MMKIERVERVAIAVTDLDQARGFFEGVFGGVFEPIEDVADQGFRYQPFTVAGFKMELLCPYRDDSTIARFIAKRGQGVHHVSLQVDDLDVAIASLASDGIHVVSRIEYPPDVVFEGHHWREAFIHPKVGFGVLFHLAEKRKATAE